MYQSWICHHHFQLSYSCLQQGGYCICSCRGARSSSWKADLLWIVLTMKYFGFSGHPRFQNNKILVKGRWWKASVRTIETGAKATVKPTDALTKVMDYWLVEGNGYNARCPRTDVASGYIGLVTHVSWTAGSTGKGVCYHTNGYRFQHICFNLTIGFYFPHHNQNLPPQTKHTFLFDHILGMSACFGLTQKQPTGQKQIFTWKHFSKILHKLIH